MKPNRIKELQFQDRPIVGGWMSTPNPVAAELLGHLGYDAVCVDLQHSAVDMDHVPALLQAIAATRAEPFVRVSGNHFAEINKVLDLGARGVICPLVNSESDARRFVDAVRYPPQGSRSWGPVRAALHDGDDHYRTSGQTVMALAMIETRAALDVADAITATEGLDGIFVGPADLAISLGMGPAADWESGEFSDALRNIAGTARRAGRLAAIWCPDERKAAIAHGMGFHLSFPATDMVMLRAEAMRRLAALRPADGASDGRSGY